MNFSDPRENVLRLGLREGDKVGDLGAGSGHYAAAAAAAVGSEGKVYAVDVHEDILARAKAHAASLGHRNVETVWGDFETPGGSKLRDRSLDAVILSNTLFQLERKADAVAEIRRILRPGGKLLVVDWAGAYGGMGPASHHVVPEAEAERLFAEAGFRKEKSFSAGPHHYSIVFSMP